MMLAPPPIKIAIQYFISFQASPCIRILARFGHSTPKLSENPSRSGHIWAWNRQLIGPSINKGAPSRAAGHEVHREFRTQRRPLNVAFVLRRTVEQGTSCPDAREDVAFRRWIQCALHASRTVEQETLYSAAGRAKHLEDGPSTPSSWRCSQTARSRRTRRSSESSACR